MASVHVRVYEELNDFLPPRLRKQRFDLELEVPSTVGDLLKKLAIPEDQVELILVNGNSVDFAYILADGDWISLYPVFESLDIRPLLRVRAHALRRLRFLVEPELFRLGLCLRILRSSVLKCRCRSPDEIVPISECGRWIVLTKNPAIARWPELERVYLLRGTNTFQQLIEVICRFNLTGSALLLRLRSLFARTAR